jgi:SNF2 family DNA or RNA helicase
MAYITGFTLLLDESQLIQNETAKRSKFILSMKPDNVILLSGTPSSGKYERLWSQVRLLGWNISKIAYWNTFIETEWIEDHNTGYKREVVTGYKNVERLKRKLAEHGAVFMKTEEAFELPEQMEMNIKVDSSKDYKKFMKSGYLELPEKELVGDTVLTKFLYARQLCGQYSADKLQAFEDLVDSTGDRLIVFYNFYEELNRMIAVVEQLQRPFSIVNGQTKDLTAYEEQSDSVTFIQYQAGAMGLNLQKANKTIYFTLPFGKGSCAMWEQSKKRTHRIGQENTCLYYYLLCKGSIEEKNLINLRLGKEYNDKLFEKEYC